MAPKGAFLLAIPHAPGNFVSLELQTTSDIFEKSPLFLFNFPVLAQILNFEFLGAIYRRRNYDSAAFEPYRDSWVQGIQGYTTAQSCLRREFRARKCEVEDGTAVDRRQGCVEYRTQDICRRGGIVRGVLKKRQNCLNIY